MRVDVCNCCLSSLQRAAQRELRDGGFDLDEDIETLNLPSLLRPEIITIQYLHFKLSFHPFFTVHVRLAHMRLVVSMCQACPN